MNIAVIGTGYVGLVTGACLAQTGARVTCYDNNRQKIAMLQRGAVPFHETGLEALIAQGRASGRLAFESSLETGSGLEHSDVVFLTIGTPTDPGGRADLSSILACARQLAGVLRENTIVVIKSTVPVGTCERVRKILNTHSPWVSGKGFVVASNPEFLAEGRAVEDFQHPERIVIGCEDKPALQVLKTLYAPFDEDGRRILSMNVRSAEFAKYACNATLAARISMVNELSCIAGQLDVDMRSVCRVLRSDSRIGPHYLQPSAGYGGSCLPKDLKALMSMAQDHGEPAYLLHSVETVNDEQGQRLFDTILACLGYELEGHCVALWGLAFKAGTDDLREAPSLALARGLLAVGAQVRAYDPVAGHAAKTLIPDEAFHLCADAYAACEGADVLVVMTDWDEFKRPDLAALARSLRAAMVFDGRYLYDARQLEQYGLRHLDVGQRPSLAAVAPAEAARDPLAAGGANVA